MIRTDALRRQRAAEMSSDSAPPTTVGIVIRTLNESALIGRCLETLRAQDGSFDLDVVVVDSGSTDDTIAIARAHGGRIVELAPHEFDYSRALNLGIERVRGELVVSLSAHAIPVDARWLDSMATPFADPRVAGVACRQVPWPDAPWQEVHRLRHQFGEKPCVYTRDEPGERPILFSNAASVIRRSVWRDHPFTLPAVEDLEWAQRVVAEGWTILYEARAAVYHSHDEGPRATARRIIDINRVHDDEGGARRTRWRTLREASGLLFRDSRTILALEEPFRRKVVYLAELLRTVGYYVLDFSRSGSTAERRREDPPMLPPADD